MKKIFKDKPKKVKQLLSKLYTNNKRLILISSAGILVLILMSAFILSNKEKKLFLKKENATITYQVPQKDTSKNANPRVEIKVEKKTDKDGNIISYDSTYTYVYKSPGWETAKRIDADSLISKGFKPYFYDHYKFFSDDAFEEFFMMDSLFMNDFMNDEEFFRNRMDMNLVPFNKMVKDFDSIRNEFLKDVFEEK